MSLGELVIDEATYTARLRGRPLDLTYKEFELLKYLTQHVGPRIHPRPAAAGGVGLRLLRRHPHRRRTRPSPARKLGPSTKPDRHGAQRGLQGRAARTGRATVTEPGEDDSEAETGREGLAYPLVDPSRSQ